VRFCCTVRLTGFWLNCAMQAHLGKQAIVRYYFPPEVDYRLSLLPKSCKGLVLWILEAKVMISPYLLVSHEWTHVRDLLKDIRCTEAQV
jgi:hypothetical protein